ncbi:MAG: hypothetical protein ACOC3A_01185, partial [Thermodesulfobacteriota bacterium]
EAVPFLDQPHGDAGHGRAALAGVAVDAVFDSVSVTTTFKEKLHEAGVIFCPISEAIRDYPELIKQYLGTVVPVADNYFAALNSAVFTDGSFVFVPKGIDSKETLDQLYNTHVKRFYSDPEWRRKFRNRIWEHRRSIWYGLKHLPTFIAAKNSFEPAKE